MIDTDCSEILCADFRTLEAAHHWRSTLGGWIFLSTAGNITWFAPEYTPSMIFNHAGNKDISGSLV